MHTFLQDVRYAWRTWRRSVGPISAAIGALALGIASTTAIFTVLYGVLIKPLGYRTPDRIVMVWQDRRADGGADRDWISPGLFVEWTRRATFLEHFGAARGWQPNLTGDGEPERLTGAAVSAGYFAALGTSPALGRVFTADDDAPGGPPIAIISHGLWQRRFGSDPSIVGRSIVLDGQSVEVVGVLPAAFQPPIIDAAQIWSPTRINPASAPRSIVTLRVLARLKDGVSLEEARAAMSGVAAQLAKEDQEWERARTRLVPLQEDMVGPVRDLLLVLMGAAALVLLIACANVASLLLARAADRTREITIRTALGAGRWRILRQLLTESLLLAGIAGAVGTGLAWWGLRTLVALAPATAPRVQEVHFDARVVGVTLLVTLLAALTSGLAPALATARTEMSPALRDGGREATASGWMRSALVVVEIALAMLLVAGAALLVRTLAALQRVDLGFSSERVLTASLQPPRATYREPAALSGLYTRVLDRVGALPGVEAAALTSVLPLSGMDINFNFGIPGRPPAATLAEEPLASIRVVSAGYFRALGLRMAEGRPIEATDGDGATAVVAVNAALARRYWPGGSALHQKIDVEGRERTIVGIVADVRHRGAAQDVRPEIYLPYTQFNARAAWLVLKTSGNPSDSAAALRRAVLDVDPLLPLASVQPMTALVERSVAQPRFVAALLSGFAAVAGLLALVGVYSMLSFTVSRRIREIGVRMALGADRLRVLRTVMLRSMALVAGGLVAGAILAAGLTRLLRSLLFGVGPGDPVTLITMALLIGAAATVASYLPARRASRVDPVVALRED